MLDSLVGISIVLRLPGGVLEKAMRDAEVLEVHSMFNITMCGEQRQAYIKILTHSYSCGVLRTCPHACKGLSVEPGHSLHIYQPARAIDNFLEALCC